MGKRWLYLGNITDGALYSSRSDGGLYLYPPEERYLNGGRRNTPDFSSLFAAAGLIGYIHLRNHQRATYLPQILVLQYSICSALTGIGFALMLIGFIRRRMQKNSVHFIKLSHIEADDYNFIRNKMRKQLPVVYGLSAAMIILLFIVPTGWTGYVTWLDFAGYLTVWFILPLIGYLFPPVALFRAMKEMGRLSSKDRNEDQ